MSSKIAVDQVESGSIVVVIMLLAKKGPAPETSECANCNGPDGQHGVKLQACARCGLASYCGRPCQQAHWRAGPKQFCLTLAERAPSAAPQEPQGGVGGGGGDEPLSRNAGAAECIICRDTLSSSLTSTLPCSHTFHAACVDGLRSFGVKQVCPVCRTELPLDRIRCTKKRDDDMTC